MVGKTAGIPEAAGVEHRHDFLPALYLPFEAGSFFANARIVTARGHFAAQAQRVGLRGCYLSRQFAFLLLH